MPIMAKYNSQNDPPEKISGSVERVTFHSEESGFCVLRVKVRGFRELVTIVGNSATVTAGEYVEAWGSWINDKNYGQQFKAQQLKTVPPSTLAGIEKYLASGMVKGIGPFFAKKLVKAFGENIFEIIEHKPQRLKKVPGIGSKRVALITNAWGEQKLIREIMVFLQSYGVGTARAVRIYKTYGEQAIAKVRENPYRLALDIHGIGFKSADIIARKLGIAENSLIRAQAGVRHVLQELASQGHCAAHREELVKQTSELLEISESIVAEAIESEIAENNIVKDKLAETEVLFLAALYRAEEGVATHIARLKGSSLPWGKVEAEKALPWVERLSKLQLSPSQQQAVTTVLENKITIITGGPGVGKTTIVNCILKIVRAKKCFVSLCAPTGRAAKRLAETTRLPAKTIHRLLEFDPHSFAFKHNSDHPLVTDLVVVDEASMLDIVLFNRLLQAIPRHAALLLIGDIDQLPSVGPGAVLSDLIQSNTLATVVLTEIFRQAAGSGIIVNAHRINSGQMPLKQEQGKLHDFYLVAADSAEEIHSKLLQIVTERIPERFGFKPLLDIQILAPMNRGGIGTRSLNIMLQQALNGAAEPKVSRFGWTFAPGDKVLQNINNYDKEVFNGDIGNIESVDLEQSTLLINFDGRAVEYDFAELDELSLAYAVSIHKSQGSEYPVVVVPLATQHYIMLARNLLYTAVTRGKQLVVIVGQKKALAMAVNNVRTNNRVTALQQRLEANHRS